MNTARRDFWPRPIENCYHCRFLAPPLTIRIEAAMGPLGPIGCDALIYLASLTQSRRATLYQATRELDMRHSRRQSETLAVEFNI